MKQVKTDFYSRCKTHFDKIYGNSASDTHLKRLESLKNKYDFKVHKPKPAEELWSHSDHILITYADMVKARIKDSQTHLSKQHQFLKENLSDVISSVHILPFFPSSSDDGFSVIDYRRVDEEYGSWNDVENMATDFRMMADMVINHISRHSYWFRMYLQQKKPYKNYFITIPNDIDLSQVTRPRSSPLLTLVHTVDGEKLVWTTFSHDQKDLNFKNPDVLFEFLDIFFLYVSKGIKVIRLDAVAFIWKEIGTKSIHLPRTHEIVKLFRTLTDYLFPDVTLITETNVPHKENISYFGDGDEAHMVYQFSLPPLLLHALVTENGAYLTEWASSLKKLPKGCTYFNFTASHDGIGMRPLEGLVPDDEFMQLVEGIKDRGGMVSYKQNSDNTMSPYELNITYYDAFATQNGSVGLQEKRYFCSQIIMLSLRGVPGIYFHNLTGTQNYYEGVKLTGRHRTINRRKWYYDEITDLLDDKSSMTYSIFDKYKTIISIRNQHPAFHPFGKQKVYDAGRDFFILERTAPDDGEIVLVICNMTKADKDLDLIKMGLPVDKNKTYKNLLPGQHQVDNGKLKMKGHDYLWLKI